MSSGLRPRRVCLVRQGYFPGDPLVRRQAEALVAHGYEVDLVCLRGRGERAQEEVAGVNVHRVPLTHQRRGIGRYVFEYSAFIALATGLVARLHRGRRYAVVQVHTMPDLLVFSGLVPRLLGARVLLVMHELMPELFVSKFGRGRREGLLRLVKLAEAASVRFADHVIIVSEPTRKVLLERGFDPGKVTVVLNAADERIFRRRDSREANDGGVVVTHGTILERSGFETIVRAIPLLRRQVPEARLSVAGAGEFLPRLRELSAELGVSDAVEFHGYVPLDDIPHVLAQADVGVAAVEPDVFTDLILPTKLMEYVAVGLPAVVARSAAVQAYFDESMVTFFQGGDPDDLASALAGVLADPDAARTRAEEAAKRFSAANSWTQMRRRYLEVVDRLAEAG